MAYQHAKEATGRLSGKLDELFGVQKELRMNEFNSDIQDVIDAYKAKIAKIEARGGKRVDKRIGKLSKALENELAEYRSELAEDVPAEMNIEEETTKYSGIQSKLSALGKNVKRTGLALLVVAAGIQGMALGGSVSPVEKYMPVKRAVLNKGDTLYDIAKDFGVPLESITEKYAEKIPNFDARTDVHPGDQVTTIGYGENASIGLAPAYK